MKFIDKNIILIFDNIDTTNKSFEEIIDECKFNKDFKKLIIKSQFNSDILGKDYIHKKYFNEFINVSEVYFEIIKYMVNNINSNNINSNNINTSSNILKFIKNITLRYDYPLKDTKTISSRIFYNNCITDIAKFIIENNLNIELFLKFFFRLYTPFNKITCFIRTEDKIKNANKIRIVLQNRFKIIKEIIDRING